MLRLARRAPGAARAWRDAPCLASHAAPSRTRNRRLGASTAQEESDERRDEHAYSEILPQSQRRLRPLWMLLNHLDLSTPRLAIDAATGVRACEPPLAMLAGRRAM